MGGHTGGRGSDSEEAKWWQGWRAVGDIRTHHTGSGMTSRLFPFTLKDRKFTSPGPLWKIHRANLQTHTELNLPQTCMRQEG
jgi:hypothetical protein